MKHLNYLNIIINKRIGIGIIAFFLIQNLYATGNVEQNPYPLHYLQRNLSRVMVNDNISPPVASRNYLYPHLAAYYILTMGDQGKKLYDSIAHFPEINSKGFSKNYSQSLAASFAFFEVAKQLVYTKQPFVDSFAVLIDWYKLQNIDQNLFEDSQKMGEMVGAEIIKWMNKDRFVETRKMNKYVLLKSPGKWQITSPGYFPAVEPHWGELRPMLLRKSAIKDILPLPYDTAIRSKFYQEAIKVYTTSKELTTEQMIIASFWDCNPFALHPTGHINHIVKKISPGGHWMNITAIACKQKEYTISKTSEAYSLLAITLFDAFIYTWGEKYEFNYLRPESYIEEIGIDANWQPYIQSPPFPEFPSGHAVVSNAAAGILTHLFGSNFIFTDDTEKEFGIPERTFHSFQIAADEATISRLYGGIHFLFSCETGKEMGKMISTEIVQKITN
jgi:membrane-associated phospholipid phosphatase